MGHRDDRHKHAAQRKRDERATTLGLPKNKDREPRMPLAGYESLYEITKSGRVFSLKTKKFLAEGYQRSPSIRFTVNGAVVSLSKDKAVADSWSAEKTSSPMG
ncbi:MAG: hypothetical protein JWL61_43 [Gemmatimonadetes bacterium]|jgi:hypothetical protein|nr:hypothetical protein [Gemmatimonadota bacterium]